MVVVVDDDDLVRLLNVEVLTNVMGLSVQEFADPVAAQQWLNQANLADVELVLTDYNMPNLNGGDLAVWIKRLGPTLPVAILTGNPSADTAAAEQLGAVVAYKPLSIAEFEKLVRDNLRTP